MSGWLIIATGAIYLWVSLDLAFIEGKGWLSLMYLCYAASNIPLYKLATG